ncbi:MAG: phospho-sugar mutase, partial [Eubacterium sp.]|nr:phospho-sugar mutase [Eubacterium sp.]
MGYREKYNEWLSFDEKTREELESIKDEKEIEDRFYKDLSFGTGGLRGIMGAGTNRMNKYTVGKATYGIANYIKNELGGSQSVVLAYDSRNNSAAFASTAAGIFASCGLKVYLFEYLVPVPVLSFSVSFLGCSCGVMLTASHNPKEYNGYKVYDSTGCQLCTDDAEKALSYINKVQ